MQFARPRSDITNGGFVALGSSITDNYWRLLTNPTPVDTIGIRTANNPSNVEFEALLTVIGPPADSSDLTLRYRYLATNGTQDLTVRVLDGATEVATFTHTTSPTSATDFTLNVPFAGITNWDDLRVEFTANGAGSCRIFGVRLEGANDTAPTFVGDLRALTPWALYRFREGGGAVVNDELANAHMPAASGQSGGYLSRPTFAQITMLADGSDTAAAFDGADDRVESGGFTSYLGNGTLVMLCRGGVVANRAANETFFRCQSAGAAGLIALQWSATGTVVIHWRNDAGSGFFEDTGYTPANDEEFLVAAVTNGTNLRVFIGPDGGSWTLEFTTTAQTAQGHDEIAVGSNKTGDALAELDVQTLAVFRSALTDQNLSDLFDAWQGGGGTTPVSDSVSLLWDALAEIADSVAIDWDVVEVVGDEVALAWDLRDVVTDSTSLVWDVRAPVADEASLVWGVRAIIEDATALAWGVNVTVTDSTALEWAVTETVSQAVGVEWDVSEAVDQAVQTVWDVEGLGTVSDTLNLLWSVGVEIADSLTFNWNVRVEISDGVELIWGVNDTISSSSQLTWDILEETSDAASLVWDVAAIGGVTDTLALAWDVDAPLLDSLALVWDAAEVVDRDSELVWAVHVPAADTLFLLWGVGAQVLDSIALVWTTEGTVTITEVVGGREYVDGTREYTDGARTYLTGSRTY